MEENSVIKENISSFHENGRSSIEILLQRAPSAKRQIPVIDSQNNTSFYQNSKVNRYSNNGENKDNIDENSQILQSKTKRANNIPRPKNNEQNRDLITKINNIQRTTSKINQANTIDQSETIKMNYVSALNKRHSSFSKGRGKENNLQYNPQREEKKGNSSLSQQRRTTEVCSPQQQDQDTLSHQKQELHQISQKYSQKDTNFENNQNKFVRQKDVIAQNKENLEKNLIKLNQFKIVEQEKGATLIRGLDTKQNYQINRIHNSQSIQQNHFLGKQSIPNKQLSFLQKSTNNNPNRNYTNKNTSGNNISYDNQLITSYLNDNNNNIIINEVQDSHLKTQTSSRGKSSKRINNDLIYEESNMYTNNKNSFCIEKLRTERDELNNNVQFKEVEGQQIGSVTNFSFSVALTEQKRYKEPFDESRAHLLTQEDEITKREWIKLHLDGNKIKNLPSNIEEEYNRIQKLTEKNEIALQEYVAIRKQFIQIQSKNKIPSSLR